MAPQNADCLMSYHACGCTSQIMRITPETTQADQDRLRAEASRRKCAVRLIKAGEPTPDWECAEHREQRMERSK